MKQIWSLEMLSNYIDDKGMKIPDSVYITEHFTWKEVLNNQVDKPSDSVIKNLIIVTKKLEILRGTVFANRPITITSGWRSPAYNKKIGGATKSYHTDGMALDFNVQGLTPKEVQKLLDPMWNGGLEFAPTWTHIDTRPYIARFDDKGKVFTKGQYFK